MTKEEAIKIAHEFAEREGILWLPPVGAVRERVGFFRKRDVWTVHTLYGTGILGGGSAFFRVDEKTGRIIKHDLYLE